MIHIKIASNNQDCESVFKFRYNIYIRELGKSFLKHNVEKKTLSDALDKNAMHIQLFNGQDLIGVARLRTPRPGDDELKKMGVPLWMQKKYCFSVASRLMLQKEHRGTGAILMMMNFTFEQALKAGADIGLIEVEDHLVKLYHKFGFRKISVITNEYGKKRNIMYCNTHDYEYLLSINSPFAGIVLKRNELINKDFETENLLQEHLTIESVYSLGTIKNMLNNFINSLGNFMMAISVGFKNNKMKLTEPLFYFRPGCNK